MKVEFFDDTEILTKQGFVFIPKGCTASVNLDTLDNKLMKVVFDGVTGLLDDICVNAIAAETPAETDFLMSLAKDYAKRKKVVFFKPFDNLTGDTFFTFMFPGEKYENFSETEIRLRNIIASIMEELLSETDIEVNTLKNDSGIWVHYVSNQKKKKYTHLAEAIKEILTV